MTASGSIRAAVLGYLYFILILVVPQQAFAVTASDNFNRANGSLGANWTDMTDGGLAISSQQVVGTNAAANSGDIRTAETYASDQYSQIQITSTQLSGGQWIGPAVRVQNGGQNLYVGLYWWNNGSPVLMLFIGGYNAFGQDIIDYDAVLTSDGIVHTMGTPQFIAHRWDSGWVPDALAALYQDSINQH